MAAGISLGGQIRRARGRLGVRIGRRVSQADLGAMIGRSRSAVNAWEKDRTVPAGDDLAALEEALGADLSPVSYPPPDDHVRRLLASLTPQQREWLIAELLGRNRPPPPLREGPGEDAGRHRRRAG